MPPSAKGKTRPICKVCPKKIIQVRKFEPAPKNEEVKEEKEEELEVEEEEEEEESSVEKYADESCFNAGGYGDVPLVTTDHALEEILPARRMKKPSFFSSCGERIRYLNLIPCDVTNDNQHKAASQANPLRQMSMLRVTSDPRWKRSPAIVATIGPSCWTVEAIQDLIISGMNIARINLAYGDKCQHQTLIRNIRQAEKNVTVTMGFRTPVAIMLDLKGPVVQTGKICKLYIRDCGKPELFIEKGKLIRLTVDKHYMDSCTPTLVFVNYPDLAQFVRPGMIIFLDDGNIKLVAWKIDKMDVICRVEVEGYLGNNRNVSLPMIPITLPDYTPADMDSLRMALAEEIDMVTLPKTRRPKGIQKIRDYLTENLMAEKNMLERPIMVFAKISNYEGLNNIDKIIEAADGIIIQRCDLGIELAQEKVFIAQKEIIAKCNIAGKPVICSTHLLRSMVNSVQASRSEMADIAACIQDGADCICLTFETAIGQNPNESIELANHVMRESDAATYQKYHIKHLVDRQTRVTDPKIALAIAACTIAEKVRAPAIVVLTTSGKSAKFISWLRPRAVVVGVTRFERTARQLNAWRCVIPLQYKAPCAVDWFMDMERKFQYAIAYGKEYGFIKPGDPIVLVSGYGKEIGFTNCVRVVYASTNPDVYMDHPPEFYSNIYIQRDLTRPQDKFPYERCK